MDREDLSFPLLALVRATLTSSKQARWEEVWLHTDFVLLHRNTHMTSITAFATIAFILADTLVGAEASILASLAWTLTITSLLAFAASLAARLGGKIFFISSKWMLEVQVGCIGSLPRLRWH
jgi:hypothetical protein